MLTMVTVIGIIFVVLQENTTQDSIQPTLEQDDVSSLSYHQQLKSTTTKNKFADKILQECGINSHCTVDYLQEFARTQEPDTILFVIGNITTAFSDLDLFCHQHGHHIGEFLYGYYGNLSDALNSVDLRCGGGLFHGIMETYFQSEVFFEDTSPSDIQVVKICENLDNFNDSQIRLQCSHGIGHGLAIAFDYDVFSSLEKCNELDSITQQHACAKGVFMENVLGFISKKNDNLSYENPFYPCDSVPSKYTGDCYQYQASHIFRTTKLSFEKSFALCDDITPSQYIANCYYGLGAQVFVKYFDDITRLSSTCLLGNKDNQKSCFEGAAYNFVEQKGEDKALKTCKKFPESFRLDCVKVVGEWIHTVYQTSQEIEKACSPLDSIDYYEVCNAADPKKIES